MSNPFMNWLVGTAVEDSKEVPCRTCKGQGYFVMNYPDVGPMTYDCSRCNGKGSYHEVHLLLNPGTDFLGPIDVTTMTDQNRLNSPPEADVIVEKT